MRDPQRFEGLEEDKITWYSNAQKYTGNNEFGLEEGKITWYSNVKCALMQQKSGLEEDEITWFSNPQRCCRQPCRGLEEDEITWYSNIKSINQEKRVWKGVKLHGFQTHATLSSQNTLGSGRNCRALKPTM